MVSNYNRLKLKNSNDNESIKIYYDSNFKTGLEWNQYIGRIIINDFIKQLDEHDGIEFAEYMGVLPYIEYGMFQSAIKIVEKININGLEELKAWLLKSLTEGEDRYE